MSQAEETSFSPVAFVAALGAFLLIGSIDATYGPLLRPTQQRRQPPELRPITTNLRVHGAK